MHVEWKDTNNHFMENEIMFASLAHADVMVSRRKGVRKDATLFPPPSQTA
jgi:hypothetical protein